MSQRAVETVVGRLVTDEGFRRAFEHDPHLALAPLLAQGISLTAAEIAALIETRATLWRELGEQIDARLQKADLRAS